MSLVNDSPNVEDAPAPKFAKGRGRTRSISMMRLTTENSGESSMTSAEKKARIVKRRGVFAWMPVLFSNDVVHGSWWFVIGSFLGIILPVLVLINPYVHIYEVFDQTLPALGYYVTWVMLIIMSFFFTIGSFFFVRAFEEPPRPPLFPNFKHLQTDELCAAWLFLLGMLPGVPYSVFWFIYNPSQVLYLALLVAASVFVFCTYLFVLACYPSDKKHLQLIKPMLRKIIGRDHWLIMHLQNDWLAGMWIFLVATDICLFGSFVLFFAACSHRNHEEIFIYGITIVDLIIYVIGCMYFVSGSYPEDKMKCYKKKNKDPSEKKDNGNADDDDESDDDEDRGVPLGRRRYDPRVTQQEEEQDETPGSVTNVLHRVV